MIEWLATTAILIGQAGPPPPGVAVVMLAGTGSFGDENRRMLASLEQSADSAGWYLPAPPAVATEAFSGCMTTPDPEACIRAVLYQSTPARAPTVVILVSSGPGFHTAWRCIGEGNGPTSPARQFITMDTLAWRDASGARWNADRATAAGCVMGAATESGW